MYQKAVVVKEFEWSFTRNFTPAFESVYRFTVLRVDCWWEHDATDAAVTGSGTLLEMDEGGP